MEATLSSFFFFLSLLSQKESQKNIRRRSFRFDNKASCSVDVEMTIQIYDL
jgi:hypothetical protein